MYKYIIYYLYYLNYMYTFLYQFISIGLDVHVHGVSTRWRPNTQDMFEVLLLRLDSRTQQGFNKEQRTQGNDEPLQCAKKDTWTYLGYFIK